jgi:hypothetical protein
MYKIAERRIGGNHILEQWMEGTRPRLTAGPFLLTSLSGDRPRSRSESLMTLPGGLAESPALVRSAFCRRLLS